MRSILVVGTVLVMLTVVAGTAAAVGDVSGGHAIEAQDWCDPDVKHWTSYPFDAAVDCASGNPPPEYH